LRSMETPIQECNDMQGLGREIHDENDI